MFCNVVKRSVMICYQKLKTSAIPPLFVDTVGIVGVPNVSNLIRLD
jgi:hypothetical protein